MVFFIETKFCYSRMERVWYSLGFPCGIEVSSEGSRDSLALYWLASCRILLCSFS